MSLNCKPKPCKRWGGLTNPQLLDHAGGAQGFVCLAGSNFKV